MSGQADGKQIKDATVSRPKLVNWHPEGHIHGCELSWVSVTQVSVAPGLVRDGNDEVDIAIPSLLTAAITASGANGLDTGSEAASTPYAMYVIFDEDGVETTASLISASFTSPTLPSGYTHSRLVGSLVNNVSSDIFEFVQKGKGRRRTTYYSVAQQDTSVLNNGSALTWTDVDCSAFVPPSSREVLLDIGFNHGQGGGASSSDTLRLRENGESGHINRVSNGVTGNDPSRVQMDLGVDASQILEYQVTHANNDTDLRIAAYIEEL